MRKPTTPTLFDFGGHTIERVAKAAVALANLHNDSPAPSYPDVPGFQRASTESKDMAEKMVSKAKRMRKEIAAMVKAKGHLGMTSEEASIAMQSFNSSVGARFRELELLGVIEKSELQRFNRDGTRQMVVYVSTGKEETEGKPYATNKVTKARQAVINELLELKEWLATQNAAKHGYMTLQKIADEIDKRIIKRTNRKKGK